MPDSIYQGKALYYSYATCGETDQWTAQHNAGKAAYFEVVKGQCTLNEDATCVFSPNYPEKYENNQKCEIMGPPGAVIQTNSFETEHGFDFMTIDGLEYHGGKGPNEVMLKSGKIEWYSDGWVTAKGWKLCTETQEGACVMQPDEVHCKRLDKCSWLDGKCLGKEAAGACKIDDPIWGSQDPPCQCIGIDGLEGDVLANTGPVGGREKLAKYPMDVGAKCKSWDAAHHPDCTGPAAPEWCLQKWCYVSPCNCKLTTPPKLSGYFPTVYHQGKPLYYSYATCGEQDEYTAEKVPNACVNQKDSYACGKLPKCAWTGKECLGKDLVETCHGLPDPFPLRAGASSLMPCAALLMLLAVNA